jgi:SAM-dependent methyltransferase
MELITTIPKDAFTREDETNDSLYYSKNGTLIEHLDSVARSTIKELTSQLVVEKEPVILDLMAGWDSHIPANVNPSRITGLGLNKKELKLNKALSDYIIHDLNENPILPLSDEMFDIVTCTISVEYIMKPYEVFREVGRVLKPGGMFLVIFSDSYFPEKATKIWQDSMGRERLALVQEFFHGSNMFDPPDTYLSRGKRRSKDDIPAYYFYPSDPVYAVYADKRGGARKTKRKANTDHDQFLFSKREIEQRKKEIKNTLCCPYCNIFVLTMNVSILFEDGDLS